MRENYLDSYPQEFTVCALLDSNNDNSDNNNKGDVEKKRKQTKGVS